MAERAPKSGGTAARVGGKRHVALGERLREERTARGISLRELARRLDVSPSLVSQIETGKIQPSVRTLYAMVSELGVSLDDVFSSGDPGRPQGVGPAGTGAKAGGPQSVVDSGGPVQRAGGRTVIDLEAGVRWERLTTENERDVEFLLAVYPKGGESAPADALVRHTGREFGIVLQGRLGVTVGFEQYELGPGDSVSFDSTVPHRLHNEGDETVEAVWVVLGRQR
ncbi:MAG: helix-turn-helix domain-containing protein [Gaiellaceae bacterium]